MPEKNRLSFLSLRSLLFLPVRHALCASASLRLCVSESVGPAVRARSV